MSEHQHNDQCAEDIRNHGACEHGNAFPDQTPVVRSPFASQALQGEIQSLEAALLFIDAAVHGNVTEPVEDPFSEEEAPEDLHVCPECRGTGERHLWMVWSDPDSETTIVCSWCAGTGEVL